MPLKRKHTGPELIAFGGVVVNHVENHLDAGCDGTPHHAFEFRHLLALRSG